MQKFKYSLEQLLGLRSYKVKEAENELGKVVAERVKRESVIKSYRKEIGELLNAETGNAVAFMQARFYRIEHLENLIKKLQNEIDNIKEIEIIAREKLADKLKQEKILEKHKEKKLEEYNQSLKKNENAIIDELSVRYYKN